MALDLEPNLAEAWASSGGLAYSEARFDRAEDSLRRAIELNPNYAAARHWYSLVLNETGQRDESLVQVERDGGGRSGRYSEPPNWILCRW